MSLRKLPETTVLLLPWLCFVALTATMPSCELVERDGASRPSGLPLSDGGGFDASEGEQPTSEVSRPDGGTGLPSSDAGVEPSGRADEGGSEGFLPDASRRAPRRGDDGGSGWSRDDLA